MNHSVSAVAQASIWIMIVVLALIMQVMPLLLILTLFNYCGWRIVDGDADHYSDSAFRYAPRRVQRCGKTPENKATGPVTSLYAKAASRQGHAAYGGLRAALSSAQPFLLKLGFSAIRRH